MATPPRGRFHFASCARTGPQQVNTASSRPMRGVTIVKSLADARERQWLRSANEEKRCDENPRDQKPARVVARLRRFAAAGAAVVRAGWVASRCPAHHLGRVRDAALRARALARR